MICIYYIPYIIYYVLYILYHILLMYKDDRHVALTAQSAVNATWRVLGKTSAASYSAMILVGCCVSRKALA